MNELMTPMTWQDIRFTTKGDVLYAICLGLPEKEVRIASLAGNANKVASVELLGSKEKSQWKQDQEGLVIQPAATWPCQHAVTYKIKFAK